MAQSKSSEPIWLSVGWMFVGIEEVPGIKNNPVIMQWSKDINSPSWYDNDDKAWCAVWMNRLMLACQLPMSGSGYELLRAKTFETWGQELKIPSLGAIMVFSRPEGNHVGIYLGERKDAYYILGANQSNSVRCSWLKKDRLTSTRWATDVPIPKVGRVWLDDLGGRLSENEA